MNITPKELVKHLKQKNKGYGFIDTLKISYRPYICPFDKLLNNLPENSKVADLGCGSGMFLSLVDEFKSPKELLGVEIEERLVTNATQLLENSDTPSTIFKYDGKTLPKNLNDFDYIYLIDVLHHIPKHIQIEYLANIFANMKPGATLVIKDMNGSSILKYWNKFHDLIFAGEIGKEPKPKQLEAELKKIGYQTSVIDYKLKFLYSHFTIECRK